MKLPDVYRRSSEILSVMITLAGCVVLAGWILDIPTLKSILPQFVAMKANTSVCFVLIGLSLWLSQEKRRGSLLCRSAARAAALIALIVGFLSFLEYVCGWNAGIDQLLFKEPATAILTSSPGRMALNTSILFIILGAALLVINLKAAFFSYMGQSMVILAGFIALFSLTGYLYDVEPLYIGLKFSTAMALHTVILFLMACASYLSLMPEKGFTREVTGDERGGIILRRLLPAIVSIPLILGWLMIGVGRSGYKNFELMVLIMVSLNLSVLGAVIFSLVARINKVDKERRSAEAGAETGAYRLKRIIDASPDMIFIKDSGLRMVLCNKVYAGAVGKKPEEMIGHTDIENGWDPVLVMGDPARGIEGFESDDRKALRGEDVHNAHDPVNVGSEIRIFDTYKVPIRNGEGQVVGVLGIARDATEVSRINAELKEKIESLEQFKRVTINRELKMMELKAKITELEGKLRDAEPKGR